MKILLVEDTRAMAALMQTRLLAFGHEVIFAENGEVALEKFREAEPDLVLMDIEMPKMNGFETASRIRALESTQEWAWTPIIFLTASDTIENLITAIEAGGDDFMAKSVPEPVLHAKMKAMSRIAALRQRLSIANQKLHELASRDGLTGLYNRRSMDQRTDAYWEQALLRDAPFAVLLLDIDNFKKYNDHYGHQKGDDCLRSVARTIADTVASANASALTANAIAARYGGEEFAIIIPDATHDGYSSLATSIVLAIRDLNIPHVANAEWDRVTASIGGVRVDGANDCLAALFRKADEQLYRAKENGRNRAEI